MDIPPDEQQKVNEPETASGTSGFAPHLPYEHPKPEDYVETPVIEPVAQTPEAASAIEPPSTFTPNEPLTSPVEQPAQIEEQKKEVKHEDFAPQVGVPPKKPGGIFTALGNILLFVILFGVGVVLSVFLRQFLPSGITSVLDKTAEPKETAMPSPEPTKQPLSDTASWKSSGVISALTRLPIPDLTLKLPPEVLMPICDDANCSSQGTYLPGGTRLTIAPRGTGQALADYRSGFISDLQGKQFTTKEATVAGRPAVEFIGDFNGATIGGYAFSRMRGVMIALTDTFSLEINHFTPSGIEADFAGDDNLFNKVIETVDYGESSDNLFQVTPSTQSAQSNEKQIRPINQ